MRKPILIILLMLSTLSVFSQVEHPRNLTAFDFKRIHFGFTVGLNVMDVGFTRNYEAEDLFESIDEELWLKCKKNPIID